MPFNLTSHITYMLSSVELSSTLLILCTGSMLKTSAIATCPAHRKWVHVYGDATERRKVDERSPRKTMK